MTKVIGVRFRTAGKIYFFSPGKLEIKTGDKVIVETARGVEFGSVVTGPKEVEDDKITQPLKYVIRLATEDDKKKEEKIKELQKENIKTYAAHLRGENAYDEEDYTTGCAFLIGNEGNGLRDEVADCADCLIRIPMEGEAESLNAAVAAAVLMFEAGRQRRKK